jgi:hypothetical protein
LPPFPRRHKSSSCNSSDVRNSREFLPLSYQIRAIQSKIIDMQETLNSDDEKYRFYLNVLEVNDRLLSRIEESLLTYYTVQQFMDFLREQLLASKEGPSRTTSNPIFAGPRT